MDQQCESKCNKLLASSTSGDTGTRVTGEAVYDKLPANGELMYLLDTMTGIQNTESTRITASILMQSLLNDGFDQAYSVLTPEEQDDLKTKLLTMIQNEQNPNVRKRACEVTALLACKLLDGGSSDNRWPDFPEFLFSWTYSSIPDLRQAALDIFAAAPGMFGTQQSPYPYQQLTRQMMTQGLTDPCINVQMAAIKAVFCYVSNNQGHATAQAVFAELLPWMLHILGKSVRSADGSAVIQCFIDIIGTYPRVLAIHREAVKQVCLKAVADLSVPDLRRNQVLEIIAKLSE